MANTGFGFKPVRYIGGAPFDGKFEWCYIPHDDATGLWRYDPVCGYGAGADGTHGAPTGYFQVKQCPAGSPVYGIAIGFSLIPPSDVGVKSLVPSTQDPALACDYRPASTTQGYWVAVVTDKKVVYEVMEDGLTASLDANDIGKNADHTVAAGSTSTGLSAALLDSNTAVTTTAGFRIIGVSKRPSNTLVDNTAGHAVVFDVVINESELDGTVGTGT